MHDTELDPDAPTPERSELMSRVRKKNTKPEVLVRQLLHTMGYRFRLYYRNLPGTPDIVFPGRKKVIFVHGCFWHRHSGCKKTTTPKTRQAFWTAKFASNVVRDARKLAQLHELGWATMVVWECEMHGADLQKRLRKFLEAKTGTAEKVRA